MSIFVTGLTPSQSDTYAARSVLPTSGERAIVGAIIANLRETSEGGGAGPVAYHRTFDARWQANLVSAASRGDREAVCELYDSTFAQVYGFAFGLTRNHEDAEDVTSETYERAFRSLRKYESREVPFIVWLLKIARNVAYARIPTRLEFDLDGLTPAQREVVALRLAGFKIREIATALGKAEGTVKALQFAAAKRIREANQHERCCSA